VIEVKSLFAALLLAAAPPVFALTSEQTVQLIKTIDDRWRSSGDWKALCYMESKEKDKTDVVYELVVFRRDAEDKMMFLFLAPKSEQGKGYLRLEKNLWFYDPGTGRWERRTERERIGGTDSRRGDFESRLADQYDPAWEADEKLGRFDVHRILLRAKPNVDVAYPVVRVWVDAQSGNALKQQDMALSGRLMRTTYTPRWKKVHSESKGADVWYPEEMRLYDEIEKANQTLVLIKQIDLRALDPNLFTKAWLESKSR